MEMKRPELLLELRCFRKLYETASRPVCTVCGLTQTELDILGFLDNHPAQDTASEIVELRMLPKANVSQAVDLLIGKGLLARAPDLADRRRVHLHITPQGKKLLPDIRASRARIAQILLQGFSEEEWQQYEALHRRMKENVVRFLEGEEENV